MKIRKRIQRIRMVDKTSNEEEKGVWTGNILQKNGLSAMGLVGTLEEEEKIERGED